MELISDPIFYIVISFILIILVIGICLIKGNKISEKGKKILFIILSVSVLLSTFYLTGSTVYENIKSETGGPVHWHADYKVIVCQERLDLINSKFPRNKVGTPLFHEHNDDRIHIEGSVHQLGDVDLGSYFDVIGGKLENGYLIYSSVNGVIEKRDGDLCNEESSSLKVYVNGKKIDNYMEYVIYPDNLVPPGDCIVFLFDETDDDKTNIICESWEVNSWNYGSYERNKIKIGEMLWQ